MTRRELIAAVAAAEGITIKEAELAVKTVFASMEQTLTKKDRVEIRGFGSFKVKSYGSYQGQHYSCYSNASNHHSSHVHFVRWRRF